MMLDCALRYATRWSVFPVVAGQKVPACEHGCKDATRDPDQIRAWWASMPDANIGIATGPPSGIFVLDVDGADGLDALVTLGHGVPATLTQHTPSGGLHFVFAYHAEMGNTARKLGPNLDTRGAGGYIVGAPSVHPNGGVYRWANRSDPMPMPGWLLRKVREPVKRRSDPPPQLRESDRVSNYVTAALNDERETLAAMAPRSGRNAQMNAAARRLGTLVAAGVLQAETVYEHLMSAAHSCGLVREDGERTCRKSIASGLSYGMQHPRRIA